MVSQLISPKVKAEARIIYIVNCLFNFYIILRFVTYVNIYEEDYYTSN